MVELPFNYGVLMEVNIRLARMREQRRENTSMGSLARIEAVAKIASLIVIPVVIALTGWWVQSSVADAGIKKDYVAMAMSILKDKSADPKLVTWVSEVVQENSPTPLSNQLQAKIVSSTLRASYAAGVLKFPAPPASLMEQPQKVLDFPMEKLKAGAITEQQAIKLGLDDYSAAKQNEITLRLLQRWVMMTRNAEQGYRESVLNDEQKALIESMPHKK